MGTEVGFYLCFWVESDGLVVFWISGGVLDMLMRVVDQACVGCVKWYMVFL